MASVCHQAFVESWNSYTDTLTKIKLEKTQLVGAHQYIIELILVKLLMQYREVILEKHHSVVSTAITMGSDHPIIWRSQRRCMADVFECTLPRQKGFP